MNSTTYIEHLENRVQKVKEAVAAWRNASSLEILQKRTPQNGWSALQCLDHLNKYADQYMQGLEQAAKETTTKTPPREVLHGWLGKKFTKMLSPTVTKPMKTASNLEASSSELGMDVVDQFLALQDRILAVLAASKLSDINQRRIPFAFFKPLKLRTSDVMDFMIGHEERHLLQAQAAIALAVSQNQEGILRV